MDHRRRKKRSKKKESNNIEPIRFFKKKQKIFNTKSLAGYRLINIDQFNNIEKKKIVTWYNYRLVEKKFNKKIAGLYLYSKGMTKGKTLFCQILSQIGNVYFWDMHGDQGWQQQWEIGKEYDCIVFNAVNSNIIPFDLIERLADKIEITVPIRNQRKAEKIKKKVGFIITSNKLPEELGYSEDMNIWRERMTVINVDNPMFDIIESIKRVHNIQDDQDDELPDIFKE